MSKSMRSAQCKLICNGFFEHKMKSIYLLLLVTLAEASSPQEGMPVRFLNSTYTKAPGFKAHSCLDHLENGSRENDFYELYDDNDQLFVAFCDLSNEPGSAWTLVMSWMTAKYRDLTYFKYKAFSENAPINENTPNWNIYRQTWARMNSLRKRSTHWRATCNFHPTSKIDYQDYLRGTFSDLDIMIWQGGASTCHPVDYISILGYTGGSGTKVGFWQNPGSYSLHIDSSDNGCPFTPLANPLVDYFGYYGDGLSTEFRCSQSDSATTQWWFGAYLQDI